jgi:rhodanese-related sulfurtransferase
MRIILSLLFVFLLGAVSVADEPAADVSLPALKEVPVSGPYCGVYAFLAIAKTFSINPDIKDLLTPKYVGSYNGSINKELEQLAKDHGLYARTHSGLTWHEVKASKMPMILHFRSTFADNKYNHWVAYLGTDGSQARMIDFPHPIATITFAELMAKWDGTAIALSDKPIDHSLAFASRLHYLSLVGMIIGIILLVQFVVRNKIPDPSEAPTFLLRIKYLAAQTAVILVVCFITGIVYHSVSETGLLRNPTAVAEVVRRYHAVDIPEITLDEMKNIVAEKAVPVFDARYAHSFKQGTIPGAKNMPVDSSLTERQQLLTGIDKNDRIVVFCQSEHCAYADEVAQFIKFNGYNNVVLYRGGYREYNKPQ